MVAVAPASLVCEADSSAVLPTASACRTPSLLQCAVVRVELLSIERCPGAFAAMQLTDSVADSCIGFNDSMHALEPSQKRARQICQ